MDLHGLKTNTVEVDGAAYEWILRLKRSRSGSKAAVTRRQRELLELMKNSDNVDQVRAKFVDLELAMRNFNEAHDRYHAELTDESAIRDSMSILNQWSVWELQCFSHLMPGYNQLS